MKRGRRRMVLMIVMILVGMVFVLPAAPVAAVTCNPGPGCDTKHPQTSGCSADAQSPKVTPIRNGAGTQIGKVELRWSPTCRTYWSRVTSWIGPVQILTEIQRRNPMVVYADVDDNATQAYNDKMMYVLSTQQVRACGAFNNQFYTCTVWISP